MLNTESLLGSKDFCKLAYTILIERHASLPQRNQSKWKSDFQAHGAEMIDWSKSYSLPFPCTRESKLQTFQFKLLHRRISTNRYLFKIGLISSELCSFCESSTETLLHLFWECPQVKIFWNEVKDWLRTFSCFCAWMWREQRNFYYLFFLILAATWFALTALKTNNMKKKKKQIKHLLSLTLPTTKLIK